MEKTGLVLKRGCKKWRYFRNRTKPGSELRRTLPINIMDNRPAHQLSRKKRNKKTTSLGATRKPSAIGKFKILHLGSTRGRVTTTENEKDPLPKNMCERSDLQQEAKMRCLVSD